jgi:diguanylate cyclase (GGDEF)-like protein/PAS domain S-box-containing protein/putative nucleotidyltransferase with HDIG domain
MIKTTCRIAITLGLIVVSVVWIAHGLNLIPDTTRDRVNSRLQLCESLAVTTSWFAENSLDRGLESIVERIGARNPDIVSVRIMKQDREIAGWGQHPADWANRPLEQSTAERMSVDILANGRYWGRVQVAWWPIRHNSSLNALLLVVFCGALVALLSWAFLTRTLKHLNPSKVVPSRVRNALNVISEGLVLQDDAGQIVMANGSFSRIVGKTMDELMGTSPDDFAWQVLEPDGAHEDGELPWQCTFRDRKKQAGVMMGLPDHQGHQRKFIVNSTPLLEETGNFRGALTSFLDVTNLENKRQELSRTLEILESSRDEIRRQNETLRYLASRDSLTDCLNRRSFFEQVDALWNAPDQMDMSVIMLDIDNFKSINDNYGHAVGDQVIKHTARAVSDVVQDKGIVCRYGGEEFCVALPGVAFDAALQVAEEIRVTAANLTVESVTFTISVGVSAREFLAMDPQHMVEQADQSLYVAKNEGKNRVVGWSDCYHGKAITEEVADTVHGDTAGLIEPIDDSVLASLYSTLYYRDQRTALHSARVANLAATVATSLTEPAVVKVLQVAALLHDIGKVGIPDSVLNKPDRLDNYEKHLMERRENIALAIARSAHVSKDVMTVISNYRRHFRQSQGLLEMTTHQPRMSLCCRILAICDAFDSMVNASEYRNAVGIEQALNTLAECAPEQFDPALVKCVADTICTNPQALMPLDIPGATLDDSFVNETVDFMTAAEAGNVEPLRHLMKRLKREALGVGDEFQETIQQLESSLNRNDEEIKMLVQSTRELLDLCRRKNEQRAGVDDFQPFD